MKMNRESIKKNSTNLLINLYCSEFYADRVMIKNELTRRFNVAKGTRLILEDKDIKAMEGKENGF